ncbi:MAG TPA: peptide-methionine (S)-S-oxide reductase MsrA [Methylococcaceae bacterium]|jgi:peptide-methionine (S)-S-oxide reductase|nr:peptide-methionine (S)-S-oxide reductase MsrA [Methylococcaceae bacterium]HIN68049.1 peptide-methionine (S)-S-oxide reductase MsrA [Methylococcales bacterium]
MKAIDEQDPLTAPSGRTHEMPINATHMITGHALKPPFPETLEYALFGLGCFWGAERLFWQQSGIFTTAVGYAGGLTPNPNYAELCTGRTGHAEVVRILFDPALVTYPQLLTLFWENHNPTQGMRQGNDIGTQYRSVIFTHSNTQQSQAEDAKRRYQHQLAQAGISAPITTEITRAPIFYYAEEKHQQYLAKNPMGYCSLGGLNVRFN